MLSSDQRAKGMEESESEKQQTTSLYFITMFYTTHIFN